MQYIAVIFNIPLQFNLQLLQVSFHLRDLVNAFKSKLDKGKLLLCHLGYSPPCSVFIISLWAPVWKNLPNQVRRGIKTRNLRSGTYV